MNAAETLILKCLSVSPAQYFWCGLVTQPKAVCSVDLYNLFNTKISMSQYAGEAVHNRRMATRLSFVSIKCT